MPKDINQHFQFKKISELMSKYSEIEYLHIKDTYMRVK